jgi:GT2 family glycosyltransferase
MAADADVLAICVNWNGKEVLGPAIQALLSSTYQPLRVLVADNGSSDGSVQTLPAQAEIVRIGENRGYGAAINRIWQEVQAGTRPRPHYYLLLNNDVLVDQEMIARLVGFAAEKSPAVYGPKILQWHHPDQLDMAWGCLRWNHVLVDFKGKQAPDGSDWNDIREVDVLQGSALLLDADVVDSVGFFDEQFFMYHEEVDFLYRARLKGFLSYYCPFAEAFHWGAHSTRTRPLQKTFWTRRNAVYFMRKHHARARWPYFWASLAGSIAFNMLSFKWRRTRTILSGVKAGFKMPVAG